MQQVFSWNGANLEVLSHQAPIPGTLARDDDAFLIAVGKQLF